MQTGQAKIPPSLSHATWVDLWLFGYLLFVVALYAAGGRLGTMISQQFGAMPVRGGLWSWVWSVDRVGHREALRIISSTIAGAVAAGVLERVMQFTRWRRYSAVIWLSLSVVAGVFFWYYRVMGSLGDAFSYLVMAGSHIWFKLSQPLSTALLAGSYAVFGKLGWPARLLVACGLLAGGVTLFFGYLETTVMAIAVAALYLYFGYRVIQGAPLAPAALTLGITLALHGQMVYLLPSYLILSWIAYHRGPRKLVALGSLLVILPPVLIVLFALTHPALSVAGFGDATGGGDNRMFVPLFKVESSMEYYTLFSFNYWTELINLALRATPLIGILLVPAAIGWWSRKNEWAAWFWMSIIGGGLSFVMLWNPDLGMPHDWDLFTPPLMLVIIAGVFLWPAQWKPRWGTIWSGAALGFRGVYL